MAAIVCLAAAAAHAQPRADHATMPPIAGASRLAASIHAMPQAEAAEYAQSVDRVHVIDTFAGLNAFFRQEDSEFKTLRIGRGVELDWDAETLFDAGQADAGYTTYTAAIVSLDAFGLRVRVDLSQLVDGDEIWIVDPTGPRAFGPYTLGDHVDGGKWLPTIEGDTAVLVARTATGARPQVEVTGLTHIYRDLSAAAKELSCNINIECETNGTLRSAATGVGIMVISFGGGDAALCSGALINNPDTVGVFEPYFLTSWHCVPDAANATQIDVVWDYRATACNTDDPPSLAALPRSSGVALLETNRTLDITLLQLDAVPSGPFGRTFLGWDAAAPQATDSIAGIHYPDGTHERISKGMIESIDQTVGSFQNQTKVKWAEGVTEPGSSGNPLLLAKSGYRIIGTLSNGPFHSCVDTSNNVDWYSSFRGFFPEVEQYLKSANPPPTSGGCAATKAFNGDAEALDKLRAFRDEFLAATAPGKLAIALYYRTSPFVAPWIERSPLAASAFRAAAKPFTYAGSKLR